MQPDSKRSFTDVLVDKSIPLSKLQEILQQVTAKYEPKLSLSKYNENKLPIRGIKDGKLSWVEYLTAFRKVLLATCLYYREFKEAPDLAAFISFSERLGERGNVPVELIQTFYKDENFARALESLGIVTNTVGLTEKQLLALSLLGNFADRRTLNTKLKAVGVSTTEFQTWLSNPRFMEHYRRQAEDLLTEVQPAVNMSLVQLATGQLQPNGRETVPDLSAIKYLNEINGRWDPAARQAMDVRVVITRIVEILTSEITDTQLAQLDAAALLNRIGGRLALMAGSLGLGQVTSTVEAVSNQQPKRRVIDSSLDIGL